ncbi:nucleotidyl transferase AbiEii/AbiGii toxin family protein [candidate division WOR-3 bacterium]|nr:nucleotidyl transferase AbiEii/AbiGii toxin family protein [candidate division WOR-3 bacterium]
MLTRDELFREAERRGLPLLRERAILREYLQILILDGVNKETDMMLFEGGTALHLIYNFQRFSEDLDFLAPGLSMTDFTELMESIVKRLIRMGFVVSITRFRERGGLLSCFIDIPGVYRHYGIISNKERLRIKVETLSSVGYSPEVEIRVLSGFDARDIVISLLRKDMLAAEKIAMVLTRGRERDYYDALFLLHRNFPINLRVLNTICNKNIEGPETLLKAVKRKFQEADMRKIAIRLEPFLLDPSHLKIIRNFKVLLDEISEQELEIAE